MNKKYFCLLVILFSIEIFQIKSRHKKCRENHKSFHIGEKYNIDDIDCVICECGYDLKITCKEIGKCEELECEKGNIYELKCCKTLKCLGKYL